VHQQRPLEARLGLELGEQPVDVVDVPGALDLGHHDHLELVADLGHQRGQVVEDPGTLERVDPRPQGGLAEVGLPRDPDQALAGGLLAVGGDRVLEVAEQDVGLLDHVGDLGDHLRVRRVEEVDHPRGLDRHLEHRVGCADREGLGEVAWVAQVVSWFGWRRER
jgi:hypothetical protein